MDPQSRKLARISINDDDNLKKVVSALMGNDPEKRLEFIQKQINNFIDEIKEEVLS
jgi:DNA gyrase/topoisomerase IV subunit B